MWGDGCVHWVHGKISFCVYLYQIIALYTLPVLQFCQLYPIKAEVKKFLLQGLLQRLLLLSFSHFSSVQSLSHVRLFATPWIAAREASLSVTNSRTLLKLMSIESVVPSSHLILCRPLLLLPPIPPSIRVFSNESALCMRWPKYWEFQLQHQSFQWTPRTDLL